MVTKNTKEDVELFLQPLDITASATESDLQNKTGNFAELAGSIYSAKKALNAQLSSLVSTGVQAYILSNNNESIEGNLKSIILVDNDKKSVTIVTAGTRLGTTYGDMGADVKDDFKLSLGFQPDKKSSIQQLNHLVLEKLGDEKAAEYHFQYVGHSLGAVVSDVAATHMATQLAKRNIPLEGKVSTATFDNPGSYTLVHKMLKKYKEKLNEAEKETHKAKVTFRVGDNLIEEKQSHKSEKKKIDAIKLEDLVDFKSFNNRDNFINTNDKQAGKHYEIVPNNQKERGAFFRMAGYMAEKMPGFVIKKILKFISYGSLSEQANDRSTDNFIDVLKNENGKVLYRDGEKKVETSILDLTHNTKPLQYNKEIFDVLDSKALFDVLPKMQDHNEGVMSREFSMYGPDSRRVEFSRDELIGFLVDEKNALSIPKNAIKDLAMHLKMDNGYVAKPLRAQRGDSRYKG